MAQSNYTKEVLYLKDRDYVRMIDDSLNVLDDTFNYMEEFANRMHDALERAIDRKQIELN